MARDGDFQSRLGTVQPDPPAEGSWDAYFQTPEGQVAKRVLDAIERGDRETAAREYEAGQQLYGWQPKGPQSYSPKTPYQSKMKPLTLPPELQ